MAACGHGSANEDWMQSCLICSGRQTGKWSRSAGIRFVLEPDARIQMGSKHGAEQKRCYLMADSEARGIE